MEQKQEILKLFLLIVVAYLFSYIFHIYLFSLIGGIKDFYWDGTLMINNPDGYYFGAGAQKLLYGLHQYNPRLEDPWIYGLVVLTAGIVKFFPFLTLNQVMLYLPAVISSLVVVPIILIGKLYNRLEWGFLSALVASIGWSYYNRTLLGYYDTDMFSAMLPMFILYFLLKGLKERKLDSFFWAGVVMALYPYFYDQGYSIIYAIGIITLIYLGWETRFREKFLYQVTLYLSIGMFGILPWWIKLLLLILLQVGVKKWGLAEQFEKLTLRQWQLIGGGTFLLFLITGNVFGIIIGKILSYTVTDVSERGLQFLNVNKTVREAGHIPLPTLFNRIAGSTIGLVIGMAGYLLLLWRHREFIIALPLWGIGFFASVGGLRFTIYGVPVAALSGVYLFVELGKLFFHRRERQLIFTLAGTAFLLLPNITHIVGCCEKNRDLQKFLYQIYPVATTPYISFPVFTNREIELFVKFGKLANPKDYAITWWDYGYYLWYYSDVNTLIDGGKHNEDNYIISKILLSDNPYLVAHLSQLAVATYLKEGEKEKVVNALFYRNRKPINVNKLLEEVGNPNYKPPKLDRDVYLFFPEKMINLLLTVSLFSDRDLMTGETFSDQHPFAGGIFEKIGPNLFYLGGRMLFSPQRKALLVVGKNSREIPIKRLAITGEDPKILELNPNGKLNLLIVPEWKKSFILSDYFFDSATVQMGLLRRYNKKLFELVIDSPYLRVYRIKKGEDEEKRPTD
ncbi:MAG: STT3 domain-containing protein [Campylobacterales bacterium]